MALPFYLASAACYFYNLYFVAVLEFLTRIEYLRGVKLIVKVCE